MDGSAPVFNVWSSRFDVRIKWKRTRHLIEWDKSFESNDSLFSAEYAGTLTSGWRRLNPCSIESLRADSFICKTERVPSKDKVRIKPYVLIQNQFRVKIKRASHPWNHIPPGSATYHHVFIKPWHQLGFIKTNR